MAKKLRILHAASEMVPFAKSGGLGDVAAALPKALAQHGHDARIAIPGYRKAIREAEKHGLQWLPTPMTIEAGGIDHKIGIGVLTWQGVTTYLLACNELFDRDGLYGPGAGSDYEDNCRRYSVFSKAVLALPGAVNWIPHIVHAHDWQTGLIPVLLQRGFGRVLPATRSVFTIHNIAYQGAFAPGEMRLTGLDGGLFNPVQMDHWGRINLLKAGIVFADRVTTVSRTYASEIQGPEHAYGLDAILRHHAYKLSGIVNGIDDEVWDPGADALIPKTYTARGLAGKKACRDALRAECHLAASDRACIMATVSRLVEQKGIDLIVDAVEPYILAGRLQLVVLGSGDLHLEHRLGMLQARHPGWVHVWYGYNEPFAHRIIAGADAFLMPSRSEPCGLTQMYAKRYGTLPVVRYTGGLADTVTDVAAGNGDGFTFGPADVGHFSSVIDRACGLYEFFRDDWRKAQLRAMGADHSWKRVAVEYADLYRSLTVAE
ncbi:MAG: hypothetical protein RLZZ127_259 [Planctomycetota bacterium]|jgi:starch synthase